MPVKKAPSQRKYSKGASKQVEREMREMKEGKLKMGRSGKKVTSRKQAIAIGLSEARKKGAKVSRPDSSHNGGSRSRIASDCPRGNGWSAGLYRPFELQ